MAMLDTRPETVDLAALAGDTLTVMVTVTGMDLTASLWEAQVRATSDAPTPAASFVITPPATPDGPAYLVLDSETTRALGGTGVLITGRSARSVQRFAGVWDCQVSDAGDDPVRTLVQGALILDLDVTREDL